MAVQYFFVISYGWANLYVDYKALCQMKFYANWSIFTWLEPKADLSSGEWLSVNF